ncbi:unnamed protein product [Brachionus calyciflorus]|uniref:Uncharacterized protein n=1 Tax=Brachionus calyciflorus TaxID=104777 RepID=A0A813N678_9BILA|nr:unnamed protein product [Brachionus calyciflorus]
MKGIKNVILEYYDSLINEIDIHTEKLTSSSLTEIELSKLNSIRYDYLNEIKRVQGENLTHLESNKIENERLEFIFKSKFCFFIPRIDLEKNTKFFKNNQYGILVITNQFISPTTIEYLKIELNDQGKLKRQILLTPKDVVDFNLLDQLIKLKTKKNELTIIDLSKPKENKLKIFELERNNVQNFEPSDLASIEVMTDKSQLLSCHFNLNNLLGVQKNMFQRLNWIKRLSLNCEEYCLFESKCFEDLKQLDDLQIEFFYNQNLNNSLLFGLENLTSLQIMYGEIEYIDDNTFINLPNLDELNLYSNKIRRLNDASLRGLKNLTQLDMGENRFEYLSPKCFEDLKKLKFLSLRKSLGKKVDLKCLNDLENLEFLALLYKKQVYLDLNYGELVLPNLKYLSINSQSIPNCKTEKLVFLLINGLKNLDTNSFKYQSQLKAIEIRTNSDMFTKINKENFSYLKALNYLIVQFEDIDEDGLNMFEGKDEYFASFLCKHEPLHVNSVDANDFSISNYEGMPHFFQSELNVDKELENKIIDFYECCE